MKDISTRDYQYFAFISYQHNDEKWAKWLQKQLENYKLPTNIRNHRPDIPQYIRPVFRDKSDLCGAKLHDSLMKALNQSKYLIVICSPHSSNSTWVNHEAQFFIDNNRESDIIPFIVDGIPYSNDRATECLPESISRLKGIRELLAVNINENGRDAAVIKVISRITELNFDSLWQRHKRDLRRQKNTKTAIISCITILTSIISMILYKQNSTISQQNYRLLINQAIAVSDAANRLVTEGDIYTAHMLALEILPDDVSKPDRPLVPEAEYALRNMFWRKGGYLHGHSDRVYTAQMSNNGEFIVSGSADNSIKIWDTDNGNCINTLSGHKDRVYHVDISDDDKLLLSVSDMEKVIKIWNIGSGECIKTIDYSRLGNIGHAQFYKDDQQIITFIGKSIIIWDIYSDNISIMYENIIDQPMYPYKGYCHIGENVIIVHHNDNTVAFWNIDRSELERTINIGFRTDVVANNEKFISIIPPTTQIHNNEFIFSNSSINVYNIKDGSPIRKIVSDKIFSIGALSPDGRYLATASDIIRVGKDDKNTIDIWDIETGVCIKTFNSHSVESISFSPCGNYVLSSGTDRKVGVFYIGDNNPDLILGDNISSAKYSPDGNLIGYIVNDAVYIYDVHKKSGMHIGNDKLQYTSQRISNYGFSDDNKYLITRINMFFPQISEINESPITVYNVKDKSVKEFYLHYLEYDNVVYTPSEIRLTKDHKYLLASISSTELYGSREKTTGWGVESSVCNDIIIWDFATEKKLYTLSGHTGNITNMIESKSGKYLYTSSNDGTIRIWDICSGECTRIIETGMGKIFTMVLSHTKNEILYSCIDSENKKHICVLDIENYTTKDLYGVEHAGSEICNTDDYIIVSGYGMNTISILSSTDYSIIRSFRTPCDITHVALSHDGKYMAAAGLNGTVYIYNMPDGGLIDNISNAGTNIEFSPTSNNFLTSDGKIYNITPLQTLINEAKKKYEGKSLTDEDRKKYYLEM